MSGQNYPYFGQYFWPNYASDMLDEEMPYPSVDVYAFAEDFIATACDEEDLQGVFEDVDRLLQLPTEDDRRASLGLTLHDIGDEPGAFDSFLRAVRARCERQLAGDLSQPLVDARPERPGRRRGGSPLSTQGYDVSLPSAGSFDSAGVAEAVVTAVLKSYADRVRDFFGDATPGVTRRLPPMRMRFDREVGLVAVRDGEPQRTRLAVVLLHDVGGEPLVYSSFPMEEVPEPPPFQALSVLFAGWLHADWVDDYPRGEWDPVEQVRRFAATEPRDTVEEAAEQLDALRSTGTEDDRRRAVRGLCSYFLPRPAGQLDAFLAEAAGVLAG